MALSNFLGNGPAGKKISKFEIVPDSQYVFLRGGENDTEDFTIKGHVKVTTSEPLKTTGVRIVLRGNRRTMHYISSFDERQRGPPVQSPIVNKSMFLEKEIFVSLNQSNIKPTEIVFPYEFELPGNTPESFEGINSQFITYSLKAVLDRGVLAKDLVCRKNIRIIRTLGEDSSTWAEPQDVNGDWPDKIKYNFSSASKAAIYGTVHVAHIELTPLIEKLEIGTITISLKESRRIKTIPGPDYVPDEGWRGMWKSENVVTSIKMEVPENCEEIDPVLQIPMQKFKARLPLPKSLAVCRQSMENEWVKIRHSVNFDVLLKNPDGHWSELRAHYGLKLFISPNVPVGETGNVLETFSNPVAASADPMVEMQAAPPDYGHHQLDKLYDDVDQSGFFTPQTMSGANTPGYGFSRRGSADNIYNLPSIAENAPDAEALQRRLRDLTMSSGGHMGSLDAGVNAVTARRSPNETPRAGSHSETAFPPHANHGMHYDMDALERMPSYQTAMHNPIPSENQPPTYDEANSSPTLPTPPRTAHVRSG